MVKLGDKTPSFGFNRFKQGLQFVPVDDEGFTLRGDKQRLEYKGRRRSHRFTILGDTAFEYDCILNREPDSNVIRLRIEGADKYDFFRQPDFVKDPFLKGSYAVYKKETLLGEGTGKLCHIHRPEIIDARGRRCWGSLAVIGDELLITIPEQWLGEAVYPVIVDPVIGTTTIGSQHSYLKYSQNNGGGYVSTSLGCTHVIRLNKVLISESIGSNISFYVYKANEIYSISNYPYEIHIFDSCPCIYNNNVNNLPENKISANEELLVDPYNYRDAGWLQAGLDKNCPINEGDYIWFGIRGINIYLRFDYGGILESYDVGDEYFYRKNLLPNVIGEAVYSPRITTVDNREILISMYLTYDGAGNKYIKRLGETARLDDTLLIRRTFFRRLGETARLDDTISKLKIILKRLGETARLDDTLSKAQTLIRKSIETARLNDTLSKAKTIFKKVFENASINDTFSKAQTILRKCVDTAKINMTLNVVRSLSIIRSITDSVRANTMVFQRRGLNRKITDLLKPREGVIRRLFIFLKIHTNSVVRSVINNRLLNAKIEITIKSRIGGRHEDF